MSWSDYLDTTNYAYDGEDEAYWAGDADESAAQDTLDGDSYLDAVQQDLVLGYDPSGDLDDAGSDLGIASDEELTAVDDSSYAADDFAAADDASAESFDTEIQDS